MKSIKKLPVAIAFIVIFMMSITPSYAQLPTAIGTEPSRTQIMWGTGAGDTPTQINPWSNNPPPFSQLMFETLFGFNSLTQTYIPVIGLDYMWEDAGRNLTINLNQYAEWSDGTIIDGEDVVNSYKMAQYQYKYYFDFSKRFIDFHEITSTQVKFEVFPNTSYSKRLIDWISSDLSVRVCLLSSGLDLDESLLRVLFDNRGILYMKNWGSEKSFNQLMFLIPYPTMLALSHIM